MTPAPFLAYLTRALRRAQGRRRDVEAYSCQCYWDGEVAALTRALKQARHFTTITKGVAP
jgi:hypothetical protein